MCAVFFSSKTGETNATYNAGYGASFNIISMQEEVTIPVGQGAGGVVTTANMAPANSLIMGVAFIVTDAPGGGATTLDIGRTSGGNLDEFIDGAACASLNQTGTFFSNHEAGVIAPIMNTTAQTLTLTTNSNVTVNNMKVRVVVWYYTITAPTS
jgi:hypothetical protein